MDELINSEFLSSLYEEYEGVKNRSPRLNMDASWVNYFQQLQLENDHQGIVLKSSNLKRDRLDEIKEIFRHQGHFYAHLDPLEISKPPINHFLNLFLDDEEKKIYQSEIAKLSRIYCEEIGFEFAGVHNKEMREWLVNELECDEKQILTDDERKIILQLLTKAEFFENFLHTKFIGQKRFSLEGAESLIPLLYFLLDRGGGQKIKEIFLGMSHRGRLNVLAHLLNKEHVLIFDEFNEDYVPLKEGTGDVKYHKGYLNEEVCTHSGQVLKVVLVPNPSHLESVSPVVEGMARAVQDFSLSGEEKSVLPVLIHGDGALSGQGIVYETLQLSRLKGYTTKGTIHIVINNQIGFTTGPKELKSTCYCTAIAQSFDVPVIHVNADKPEAVIKAVDLALKLRMQYESDVFIDLICYRKYGHNESDEPVYTQPNEYAIIKKKKSVRLLYKEYLIFQNILKENEAEIFEEQIKANLNDGYQKKFGKKEGSPKELMEEPINDSFFVPIETGVDHHTLITLAEKLQVVPNGFQIHPKLAALISERYKMISENQSIDWGMAELLAYATLIHQGVGLRLSGQDSARGTFSHRHAVWIDQNNGKPYSPLVHLAPPHVLVEIINSPLSEFAVLGFEYGYSVIHLHGLTIWEAQFGDFVNGAQIIIDQYISSAEQKWGQKSRLVVLLPHGYEGQGPEHSSGRLERFLTLTGHDNMTVAYPTTPAQLFHLLRRQQLSSVVKPLIVFTPKGLLRHPLCTSKRADLEKGHFQTFLFDDSEPEKISRLIFCTGRIYYDLLEEKQKRKESQIAMIRIEQLYPMDEKRLQLIIETFKNVKEYLWVQEEPKNMGAWTFIQPYFENLLSKSTSIKYVGRERSASPATGFHRLHLKEHQNILKKVFDR